MIATTARRIVFAGIVIPALVLGAPAVAMADTYYEAEYSKAGSHGAFSYHVKSYADDDGDVFFKKSFSKAGSHGAFSYSVSSGSD
ncbi:hypothetical protein HDA32_002347 [Spinactinospora alkalitolerans]|uniref:Uncharacterized protein n=1 Tax=Spinactinospora alkalitolerans TaxID=687207 RepID=A0A852TVA8_9ACTN|nr:hypothetical protein [Spinactinospora alkalitolerans]NYE47227.1 hypothetical protein [Spinactinospora alkalitolerans]